MNSEFKGSKLLYHCMLPFLMKNITETKSARQEPTPAKTKEVNRRTGTSVKGILKRRWCIRKRWCLTRRRLVGLSKQWLVGSKLGIARLHNLIMMTKCMLVSILKNLLFLSIFLFSSTMRVHAWQGKEGRHCTLPVRKSQSLIGYEGAREWPCHGNWCYQRSPGGGEQRHCPMKN